MGEVVYLKGATARVQGGTAAPLRQPVIAGGGRPASQCERLGEVARRVVKRAEQAHATTCRCE